MGADRQDIYGGRRTSLSILHARLMELRQQPVAEPIRYAWAAALGVDKRDVPAVWRGIAETANLIEAAKLEAEQFLDPLMAALLVQGWNDLRSLISVENLIPTWGSVSTLLNPPVPELILSAHIAVRHHGAIALPNAALREIRDKLHALIMEIGSATDLDQQLQQILLQLLDQALRILDEYELGGPIATEQAVQRFGGLYAQHRKQVEENGDLDLVKRAASLSGFVVRLTAAANNNQGLIAMLVGVGQIVATVAPPVIEALAGTPVAGLLAAPTSPMQE